MNHTIASCWKVWNNVTSFYHWINAIIMLHIRVIKESIKYIIFLRKSHSWKAKSIFSLFAWFAIVNPNLDQDLDHRRDLVGLLVELVRNIFSFLNGSGGICYLPTVPWLVVSTSSMFVNGNQIPCQQSRCCRARSKTSKTYLIKMRSRGMLSTGRSAGDWFDFFVLWESHFIHKHERSFNLLIVALKPSCVLFTSPSKAHRFQRLRDPKYNNAHSQSSRCTSSVLVPWKAQSQ
jgi:hypothetical protein